jgi:molybdate transport system substrate-binding protein
MSQGPSLFRRSMSALGAAMLLYAHPAAAADVRVLCSNGFREVMNDLVPNFERTTANHVEVTFGLSTELARRIRSGEPFDLAILTPALIDELRREGVLAAASGVNLARSAIALAIKQGSPKPDVRDLDAVRRTLLAAPTIAYAKEGASAEFFLTLVGRLGLSEQLKPKIVASASGAAVASAVAAGDTALGVMPVSEVLPVAGIEVGGTFPADLAGYITMTAAISNRAGQPEAAGDLLRYLTADSAAAALRKRGMDRVP